MEIKELICINCPMGCNLTVTVENGVVLSVTGNTCPRGIEYGKNEVLHPVRTLTSTVRVDNREIMLPVRSDRAIPKECLFEAMEKVNSVIVSAPVSIGDVLLSDFYGANLIATMNVD